GRIDLETGKAEVLEPPVKRAGTRRAWSDSQGAIWISGWESGDLLRYDSMAKTWKRWHLPGDAPQAYAVYVDETDAVWVSDWGSNAILRFDPKTEKFESFPLPDRYASVRQLAGRKGEVWGAESGADKIFVPKPERPIRPTRQISTEAMPSRRRFPPRAALSRSCRRCSRSARSSTSAAAAGISCALSGKRALPMWSASTATTCRATSC